MRILAIATGLLAAAVATPVTAAPTAYDDASDPVYDDGWSNGDAGGSGWGGAAWVGLAPPAVYSVATSTANGDGDDDMDGDIDTGGRAWAITVSTLAVPANATRLLEPALASGQTLTIEIDHDAVPEPGAGGIRLTSSMGEQRFALIWYGSNQDYFVLDDGFAAMGVPYTDEGLEIAFHLTGPDTYTVDLTPHGGSTTSRSGTLAPGVDVRHLILNATSSGAAETWYFNSITVPEPAPAVSTVVALAALLALRRRVPWKPCAFQRR
jgi:hypothetical protein